MILEQEDRKEISSQLQAFLADTYTLYLKTQNYHWNVTGPHFGPLHALFEEHYTNLASAVDEIAERIRALGRYAPGSFQEFGAFRTIEEADKNINAMDMVSQLRDDHETIAKIGRKLIEDAEECGDASTADLITERLQFHEQAAWMLRSHLE